MKRKEGIKDKEKDVAIYKVIKKNLKTGEIENFGTGWSRSEAEQMVKGYKFNGEHFARKGSNIIYIVE